MRLGVFDRLVIVASAFWMVLGTLAFAYFKDQETAASADEFYKGCAKGEGIVYATKPPYCWYLRQGIYQARSSDIYGGLFGFAAVQAGLDLLVAHLLIVPGYYSVRWIMAGRER